MRGKTFSGELLTSADIRRIREAVREITHHDNQLIVRVQPDSICMIGPQTARPRDY